MGVALAGAAALQAAAQRRGKFALVNLCGGGTVVFDWFPTPPIEQGRRANWKEQETTNGTKPLFYANRDPRRLDIREVWLDRTDTSQSIKPQIEAILALQDEVCEGTPPPVLAVWGDYQERLVLEEARIEQTFHTEDGDPIRARVSLTLKEVQAGDR